MNKKVEISKENVYTLYSYFDGYKEKSNKGYIEFLIRNKNKLKEEFDIIETQTSLSDDEKEYLQKEYDVISKYSINNSDIAAGQLIIKKDEVKNYEKAVSELTDDNKEIIDSIKAKEKERTEMFKDVIELELKTVKYEYIPDEIDNEVYEMFINLDLIEYED